MDSVPKSLGIYNFYHRKRYLQRETQFFDVNLSKFEYLEENKDGEFIKIKILDAWGDFIHEILCFFLNISLIFFKKPFKALCPPANASPHRQQQQPDLNNFLQTQLYRHRKRAHSPSGPNSSCSSPNYLYKRFKRL